MRRYDHELTLDIRPAVSDASDDIRRPSQLKLADRRPQTSSCGIQQSRRRSTGTRQQLMGCVSGQRSPTTPTAAVILHDVGKSRPPIDPAAAVRERHSPCPSKCYRPALSVYCDQVVRGSSTLVSAAAAAAAAAADSSANSTGDSGIDVNSSWSFEKDELDRRGPSASGRGRSRSTKTTCQPITADHSAPLSNRQVSGDPSVEELERETDSGSKRDRKSRSRSPASIWRSISSSSLMRSLSHRRAASKSRSGVAAITAGAASQTKTAASRSKLSSLDTDSDCENRDAATEPVRRRRFRGGSSSGSGGSLTGLGLEVGNSRRQSGAAVSGETHRRRSGIGLFGGTRSFRRTQTTAADDTALSQSATLPRRRRANGSDRSTSPGPSRLSSRAASWASLRRSQTSESLSLTKTQISQLSNGFNLVTTLKLSEFMTGRLISGMAITDKHELVVVDLRAAYLVDSVSGRQIRVVGGSGRGGGAGRLAEPIGAATAADGRLVFSDRADQTAKVYSARGHHVRTVAGLGLSNVGGVAVARATGDVYVAGSDCHGVVLVRGAAASGAGRADAAVDVKYLCDFEHPYSVAVNSTTGDVVVGDDHTETVTCLTGDGQTIKWRWCPPSTSGDQRPFFPSAISVDCTSGHVFIADLYNEKIYRVDAEGRCCCGGGAVLTRGAGLRGGPAAIAVDGVRRLLYVADEERTVHVFSYSAAADDQQQPTVGFSTLDRQGSADEVFC